MEVDLTCIDTDEQSDDSLPASGLMQTKNSHNRPINGEVHCLSSSDESEPKTTALSSTKGGSTTSPYSDSEDEKDLLPSLKERVQFSLPPDSNLPLSLAACDQPKSIHEISSDEDDVGPAVTASSSAHHVNGLASSSAVVDLVDTDSKESLSSNIEDAPKKRKITVKNGSPKKPARIQKQKEERAAERAARQQKKEEDLQAKKQRAAEKEAAKLQKKIEKEREKLLRDVVTEARRKEKPGECIKLMKVLIDCHFVELPEGALLLPLLQSLNIRYQVQTNAAPYSIMWQREVSTSCMDDDNKIVVNTRHVDEDEVIIQIPLQTFVNLVDALKQEQAGTFQRNENLLSYVKKMKTLFIEKRISFIAQGLAQYLRDQKSANQRKVRSTVLGTTENPKRKTKARTPSIETSVTEMDVEESLVIVQVQECCDITLVETSAEVANMVSSFTKAIAEAPYKREKHNNGFSWFAALDSRKCVRVQDSGEGLLRLWQQHIEQFNLVGTEAAQAVVAEYPSPTALLQAYGLCSSIKECEALLQDIQVRRGAGPLARTRRIGPELARKLYWFLTSSNPNFNLNAT